MVRLEDYDYELPERAIAQIPLADRTHSKLVWVHLNGEATSHHRFFDVPHLLRESDLLVVNDTRVTALRLYGHKASGGKLEALLLRPGARPGSFEALLKPARRLPVGTELLFEDDLRATVAEVLDSGQRLIQFDNDPCLEQKLESASVAPLPPYIHEPLGEKSRYQTVYNAHGGSAAAPTAGLHFTQELLADLQQRGIQVANVTLDVGLDTFRPLQQDSVDESSMHGERCAISEETAEIINTHKGRIIAVGTTTTRTLESFAIGKRQIRSGSHVTRILIAPSHEFQIIDGLFTNFHMPRTTMLLMLAALAGRERILSTYAQCLERDYRFLSFGDSMLII